jgi:hypothetical protein
LFCDQVDIGTASLGDISSWEDLPASPSYGDAYTADTAFSFPVESPIYPVADAEIGDVFQWQDLATDAWVKVDGGSVGSQVWVYTQGTIGRKGKWSRYIFPFVVKYATTLGNTLYMMGVTGSGTSIYKVDKDAVTDNGVAISGIVQWQWLDFGSTGTTKMMETVDIVGDVVAPTISIGYDQTNPLAVTTPYQLQIDSMCGFPVPIPVSAPTFSIKLEYAAGGWELQQFNVEVRQNWKIR